MFFITTATLLHVDVFHYYSIHTHRERERNTLIQMRVRKILGQYIQSILEKDFKSWYVNTQPLSRTISLCRNLCYVPRLVTVRRRVRIYVSAAVTFIGNIKVCIQCDYSLTCLQLATGPLFTQLIFLNPVVACVPLRVELRMNFHYEFNKIHALTHTCKSTGPL